MKLIKEYYSYKDMGKELSFVVKHRIKCSHCDTKVFMGKAKKVICPKCKNYIYQDKKEEFKNNLRKVLKYEKV